MIIYEDASIAASRPHSLCRAIFRRRSEKRENVNTTGAGNLMRGREEGESKERFVLIYNTSRERIGMEMHRQRDRGERDE